MSMEAKHFALEITMKSWVTEDEYYEIMTCDFFVVSYPENSENADFKPI